MTMFPALQPYLDRGQLRALLMQDALGEATATLGPNRWDVDMPAGTLTFTADNDPNRRLQTRAHLIASIAPGPRSVLWGWAHPQGDPAGPAGRLRDAGATDGVRELSEGEVTFPDASPAGEEDLTALAHQIGTIATGITNAGPYYAASVGSTRIVLLLDAPIPPLTLTTVVTKLPRMLATGLMRDPRTALWALAAGEGWNFQWTDATFNAARVTDGTSAAEFGFDDRGLLTTVSGSLTSS